MRIMLDRAGDGPCVLVLGMFDGVHRGHQALLTAGRAMADRKGLPLYVYTFEPHPLAVLRPEIAPPRLTSASERAGLMASYGVDGLCVRSFTRETAAVAPNLFLAGLLADFMPRGVVCGYNFTFGEHGGGSARTITAWGERYGIETQVIDEVTAEGGTVSSTRIRQVLEAGDADLAARLLARHYTLTGDVMASALVPHDQAVRAAAVRLPAGRVIPGAGVYAGCVTLKNGGSYHAVINVPERDPRDKNNIYVHMHALDAWLMLFGKRVRLTFLHKLRDEMVFTSKEQAISMISGDVDRTRKYFTALSRV